MELINRYHGRMANSPGSLPTNPEGLDDDRLVEAIGELSWRKRTDDKHVWFWGKLLDEFCEEADARGIRHPGEFRNRTPN